MDLINLANNNQSPDCSMDCWKNYLPLISCDCFGTLWYTYKTVEEILAGNCDTVHTCINTQLWLVNAWALTNFNQASVNAIVDYFSQSWVQAPTAAEVCAYLSSLAQNTTIDGTTKLVLGSCEYGTVGDLATYLSSVNDIALYEISTDNWILYTFMDGSTKSLKTGHTEIITPTANTPYTITHNLNSTRIHIEARDVVTNKMVDVEFSNRTLNTVDVTSTTIDDLEIIIKL